MKQEYETEKQKVMAWRIKPYRNTQHVVSYFMAPLCHHGTIAPRAPKKNANKNVGKMPPSKS